MFDYAKITSIHEYLKQKFPGVFVHGFAGAIVRFGDAHIFEIHVPDHRYTLTVSHRFLMEHAGSVAEHFDAQDLPARLARHYRVIVSANGRAQEADVVKPELASKSVDHADDSRDIVRIAAKS